ncbi:hypothetical protein [Tahibacter harae]|uniref:Uncharacterized protein n=1 Tax=Tahibacter harae TaxID=2963937 RepID=A0ABT1QN34_9GAMM|nr:hypothetical protein [Tahibacter harae]MCQ4163918.1 hypothetical protein [Tahibacter harae]
MRVLLERNGRWLNAVLPGDGQGDCTTESSVPTRFDIPLRRRTTQSLPLVDAVFLHGSPAVGNYLEAQRRERVRGLNDNFADEMPHPHEKLWQEQCPCYSHEAIALEDGRPMPWSDGSWYALREKELVPWTFPDEEPWEEVFLNGNDYQVIRRIT